MGYIDDLRKEYQELTKQKAQENTKYNVPTSLINQYKNEYAQLTGQAQQPVQPTISQPNFANHASMSQQGHNNIAQKQATIDNNITKPMTSYLQNGGKIDINDTASLAQLAREQGAPSQQIAQATQNTNNQGIGGIANRIGTEIKSNNLFDDVNTSKYFEYENKLEDAKARGNAVDTAVYQNLIDRMDEDYKPKTKNWYSGKQNLQEHEQNIGTTIDILKYYEDKVLNAKTPEEVQEYLPKYQQEYKNYQNAVSRYQDAKLYNKYNGNPVLDELDILGYTGASTLSGILDEAIENVHNDSEVLRGKSFDYIKPSELIKENNARKSGTIPANLQRLSLSMNALREQATRENATDDLKNLYEQIMNGTYTGTEEGIQRVLDNAKDEKYKLEAKENVNTKLRQKKEEFDYNYQPSPAMKYVLENGLEQVIGMTPIYAANLVSPFLGDVTMYQSAANSAYDRARENGATASQARANKTLSGLAEAGFEHLVQSSIDAGFERGGLLKPTEWAENIANPWLRTGVGVGVDVTGEGLEEVASEVTQPIIDRITYDPNAKMATVEEVWGAFTGSILPTLIMQGAGYTLQKVDTFVNKAKSNINNSNLTDLQKAELINQVENGRKEILKQIEQRKQEIDTQTNQNNQIARDTEALNMQPAQNNSQTASQNVLNNNNISIADKVTELNKQGYNIPKTTADILQTIQDQRGVTINFDANIKGNGTYNEATRTITLNPNSKRAIEFTTVHELAHDLKSGNMEDYTSLQNTVLDYARKNPNFLNAIESLDKTYKDEIGKGNYNISDEATNDILAEAIGNQEFLNSLAQEKPNLFERIYNWFKNVLFDGNKSGLTLDQRRTLNKMQQGFRNAYQKAFNGTQQNGVQQSLSENKQKQLEIIQQSNPMRDDYHTGIRNIEDIKTYQEAVAEEGVEGDLTPDYTADMVQKALDTGKVTVYSSYPIENGTFVTPSKMEAQAYAGGNQIYSKEVNLDDVAWIDNLQGQYAKIDTQYSLSEAPTKDSKGRTLTPEQADYFKNSKVRDRNGNLLEVYHGTNSQFNKYNIEKFGQTDRGMYGKGFYFTDQKEQAKYYGNRVKKQYLKIDNPLYIGRGTKYQTPSDYVRDIRGGKYDQATLLSQLQDGTYKSISAEEITNVVKENGYDGIIVKPISGAENEYIVFEPNQIKNVDNITPTSNPDTRYSLSEDVDINSQTDYNGVERKQEPRNYVYKRITNKDRARVQSDYLTNPNKYDKDINVIDFDDASYVVEKISDNVNILQKFKGNQKFVEGVRAYVEGNTNTRPKGYNRLIKSIGSRLQNYNFSDTTSGGQQQGETSIDEISRSGQEQRTDDTIQNVENNGDNLKNSNQSSFSMQKDNQGRQLSKGQQSYFRDSKARDENGNLETLYHTTPENFTVFDNKKLGDNTGYGNTGYGFFVTPNQKFSTRFGDINEKGLQGNTMQLYANIKNPITHPWRASIKYGYGEKLDNIVREYLTATGGEQFLQELEEIVSKGESDSLYDAYMETLQFEDIFEASSDERKMLESKGYDSVEIVEGRENELVEGSNSDEPVISYAIFRPNQLKNINNTTPTDNEDIRYQKSNGSWQQFLDDTYGKWNTGTKTNFTKTDATMLPSNEQLQQQENKGINAILKDLKIPTNEELQKTERESIKNEPIVQANKITQTKRLDDVRNFKEVGNRKVNAYQYDNPEVKPFFQQEAKNMLYDLNNAVKGERTATWDDYGELHYSGVTRETVQDIADLLDGKNGVKLSYADIEKGLNAIIEDKGSENIAAAKRIEMVLDKRLREGYTDSYGTEYEPNDNYLNFLAGKDFIDPAEYDKQVQDKLIADYEAKNDDGTLFSLSEEEAKEVSDYVDKIYEDNTLDEEFRNKIIQEINKLANYDVFKDIKQEVKEYKEKNYGSISEPTQPKPKTVKWTETAQKNELVRENVEEQKITYVPSSNKQQIAHANKQLEQMGYDDAKKYLDNKVRYNEHITATDIALGERLIQEAIKKGDINQAQELIADTAILGKDYGQVIQALSMISRMTPEGQLMYINKVVDRLNDKIDTKNEKRSENKKANNIEIDKELAGNILKATNEVELQNAVDAVLQNIADQMEVSLPDKIAEWRYLAMLANPRTHIRNSVANVGMKGLYGAKNQIQRAIETVAAPLLDERTRTYKKATADVKKFAEQSTKDLADILGGNDNKTIESRIKEMRKVFKNESLEKIRRFNSNMLSLEDNVFTQAAYKANLQEYLTANGIKTQHDIDMNPEIVQKGINFAKEEAWKTTFHQMSKAATAINRFENINGYTKLFAGGVIPFKKTPINIAKTGAAYSPLGLLDTLSTQTYKLKSGQITANQYIDRLSQGLTGSALFGIGALLAKMGILRAGTDKDDEYAEQIGQTKSYSVRLGDKNYDISWFAPSAMPLLMGAELVETAGGKEVTFSDIAETLASTINPLSEMSFVSGLNSSIRSYSSSDSPVDAIGAFGKNAAKSYFGQFVPTIGGQINKIIDKTERSTTATKDSPWKEGETFARQQINKIPGGSFLLEPKTDVWGNEKKRDSNVAVRAFDALINPGTVTKDQTTRVDKEIMELAKEADDTSIKPSIPKSYFTYNKEDVNLSAKDYTKYKKIYGQYMYNTYDALLDDEYYKSLEPAEKAKVLKNIATDSRNIAKNEVGYQTNEYFKYDAITDELEKNGIPLVDYYLIGRDIKMSDSKTKKKTAIAQTSESMNSKDKDRITSQDKKVLWDIFGIN